MKSHEISVEEGYFRAHWIDSHDSMTTERANSIVAPSTILFPYSLSSAERTHIFQHGSLALGSVHSNDNDAGCNPFHTIVRKIFSVVGIRARHYSLRRELLACNVILLLYRPRSWNYAGATAYYWVTRVWQHWRVVECTHESMDASPFPRSRVTKHFWPGVTTYDFIMAVLLIRKSGNDVSNHFDRLTFRLRKQ